MKKKILVIDDDSTITTLLAHILAATGDYDVEATNDPQYAFRRATEEPFDLIIADWQMPSLNGDMLFRRLYTGSCSYGQRRSSQPRLLLMSGFAYEEKISSLLAFIGGASYLQKPFDIDTLVNKVEGVLFGEPRCLGEEITRDLDRLDDLQKPSDIGMLANKVEGALSGEPRCLGEEITQELDRLEMQAC